MNRPPAESRGGGAPAVSVVVPAFNAASYLRRTLPALCDSSGLSFEMIVVDDGSTDDTAESAAGYADIILRLPFQGGPAKARNAGAGESRGDILFFVDADVLLPRDALSRVVRFLDGHPSVGAVFGSYDEEPAGSGFISQFKNLFHHYVHQNAREAATTFWAGCGAVRKAVFFSAGGFPETYRSAAIEDVDMGYRLAGEGVEIRLLKDLQVKHLKTWTFCSLLRTDIFARAVPWTRLALEKGLPRDLNFKPADRAGGALVLLLTLGLALSPWRPAMIALPLLAGGLLVILHRRLYGFFLRKKGLGFAAAAALFHWFYLFYGSLAFILAGAYFLLRKVLGKSSASGLTAP